MWWLPRALHKLRFCKSNRITRKKYFHHSQCMLAMVLPLSLELVSPITLLPGIMVTRSYIFPRTLQKWRLQYFQASKTEVSNCSQPHPRPTSYLLWDDLALRCKRFPTPDARNYKNDTFIFLNHQLCKYFDSILDNFLELSVGANSTVFKEKIFSII